MNAIIALIPLIGFSALAAGAASCSGTFAQEAFADGVAAQRAGDMGQARADYVRALQSDPATRGAANNLGIILSGSGEHEDALAWVAQEGRRYPDAPELLLNEALIRARAGDSDRALPLLASCHEKLSASHPDVAGRCAVAAAQIRHQQGRPLEEVHRLRPPAGAGAATKRLFQRVVAEAAVVRGQSPEPWLAGLPATIAAGLNGRWLGASGRWNDAYAALSMVPPRDDGPAELPWLVLLRGWSHTLADAPTSPLDAATAQRLESPMVDVNLEGQRRLLLARHAASRGDWDAVVEIGAGQPRPARLAYAHALGLAQSGRLAEARVAADTLALHAPATTGLAALRSALNPKSPAPTQ